MSDSRPFVVTADWHWTASSRSSYRFSVVDFLLRLCSERRIGTVFMLGDLTTEKDKFPGSFIRKVVSEFRRLLSKDGPIDRFYFLVGNHDFIDVPTFAVLGEVFPDRVVVIERPRVVDEAGMRIGLIPFGRHKRFFENGLKDVGPVDMVMTHGLFAGSRIGGTVSERGPSPDVGVPVLAGDVHASQTVGDVTYVGSPYHVDFGDDFDPRVLVVHAADRFETVTTDLVRKHVVRCGRDDAVETASRLSVRPYDQVRFVVHTPPVSASETRKLADAVRDNLASGVFAGVRFVFERSGREGVKDANVDFSPEGVFSSYCRMTGISGDLYEFGMECVREVSGRG